ncbi:carbohydrate binding family 9 domain-containing protein [Emticicia sp. 17c]|uniref:carbohydrate binding family 9 domain-containing protein n=1 Tax=Emticicia sp. 17c TaxID=3127704 RepID=UPI00301DF173
MIKKLYYLLLFVSTFSFAQDASIFKPDSIKKTIEATPIITSLKVDGVMNDAEWRMAKSVSDFIQIEPFQGKNPTHKTEVRVLYNKHYLYFGIFAHDSLGKKAIRATDFRRDFSIRQHDLIGLSFDGFNDKRNAMALVTNPYGVQRDFLSFDDIYYDIDWDGLWRVRTTRTDSGWVAEMAIPWQTLRYPKTDSPTQNWGFNMVRNRRLTNEQTAFSPYPRSFTNTRMAYAAVLTNLQPPPPSTNIRVQPYLLTSVDRYKNFENKPDKNTLKLGGEIKWAINPNAILDLTVNTDFAQADADRQVNNVTRFSVFFPERRQFFLENASLFGVGVGPNDDQSGGSMRVQPFFSRTIGLDNSGNPIPIDVGARFVYRSLKRNYGAILMRQREVGDSPGTNFFVGRFSENFGKQNRIGGLVTVKNSPLATNLTTTIDGFFRLSESHSLNTMAVYSTSTNGGKQGFSGFAQYYYTTNQFKVWWTESIVTKNFNPEMGFVSRSDVIGTTPGIFFFNRGNWIPFKKFIRAFEPGIMTEFYHQASTGKLIERQLNFNPIWLNFQRGGFLGYLVNPTFQRLTEPFEPLGVQIGTGDYNYVRHQIYASTDPSKIISLNTEFNWGTYFNGKLTGHDMRLQFAPIPHISILGRYNRNHFKEVGEARISKKVDLFSIEGRFALNPRVQLIGFYQRNSENNLQNYNIRLSWEYQPLSYIYVVFNHRGFDNLQTQKTQSEDHVIAKISYLKQF